MLTLDQVLEVKRLLDAGELSQRKIATKLGVSRGTVNALATGRRGIYGREPTEEEPESGPPERCKSCGVKVFMPCVYCQAIEYRRRTSKRRRAA